MCHLHYISHYIHVHYTSVKMCQWLIVMMTFASKCDEIKILLQTLLISQMLLDNVKKTFHYIKSFLILNLFLAD